MIHSLLWLGALAGLVHFAVIGILYGNPLVGRVYARAMAEEPGVRKWPSRGRYLATQFLGTQVEVYLLALAFLVLRPHFPIAGAVGALVLGALLASVRVFPRFWNMWIQSTYPRRLLAIEVVNGVVGTLVIVFTLQIMS